MKSSHNKSDDEINEFSLGSFNGKPLKRRKITNVSLDGKSKQYTEYVTKGLTDKQNRPTVLYEIGKETSELTGQENFIRYVMGWLDTPISSGLFVKTNDDGSTCTTECFTTPEDTDLVIGAVANMVGNYYKRYAYDPSKNDYDYDKLIEFERHATSIFYDNLDQFLTDEEKLERKAAIMRRLRAS